MITQLHSSESEPSQQPSEEWEDNEYEEEWDDEDIDAKAEEMARRLGEELLANISGAKPPNAPATPQSRAVFAAITTIKAILTAVDDDLPARHALQSTTLPNTPGDNVLDTLKRVVVSGTVSKAVALALSPVLVSLARSDALFGNLRMSNASSMELDKGKRKRKISDDSNRMNAHKRAHLLGSDVQTQVNEAVRVVSQALESSPGHPLDSTLVSNIQLQLHQVFLFAVTSSAGGGGLDTHTLQEIGGLIQVIGVLSGIQIGQPPDSHTHSQVHNSAMNSVYPWPDPQNSMFSTDIGTAVYPCIISGCKKTFSRLYSLRAHQRLHSAHRPFHCHVCPASFARNHDLKRHIKLHDKKAWKCGGCQKIFSRRDAIKRHKTGSKTRGPRSEPCITAEVVEVDLDGEEGEDTIREERRAKIWSGIVTSQADAAALQPSSHKYRDPQLVEEGEIHPSTISAIQASVLSLHEHLQARVGAALGGSTGQANPPIVDPAAGQTTLASVIARAQMQTMPVKVVASETLGAKTQDPSAKDVEPSDFALDTNANLSDSENVSVLPATSLLMYGLSEDQTKMLEEAIASAASAAQAQAEAEAALEEEDEEEERFDSEDHSVTE